MRFGAGTAPGRVRPAVTRRQAWTLRLAAEDVLVVRRGSLQAGEGTRPIPPSEVARWLVNPRNRSALYSLYAAVTGQPAMLGGSLDHGAALDHVKGAVEVAFRRGRLLVVGTPPAWSIIPGPGAVKATDDDAGGGAATAGASTKTKKTWIEIRLVNKQGDPVTGAKYRLKLTDGSVQEGSTDDFGSARVSGIDPGTCEVSFLEFDAKEWKKA